MKRHLFYIILSFVVFSQTACVQSSDQSNNCYSDKLSDKEKVFIKMANKPHFKGGSDSLVNFLSENINFEQFVGGIFSEVTTYSDTARIKFIVNRQGGISELSVRKTKHKQFADEITRVIKKSSCNWVAGRTEALANGWHHFDIYYSIEKKSENEIKTVMTVNEI